MSKGNGEVMSVKILPNESGSPKGKLADAEVIFEAGSGPFSGLRLLGFAVWERQTGGKNVTFLGLRTGVPLSREAANTAYRLRGDGRLHPCFHRSAAIERPTARGEAAGRGAARLATAS